MTAETILWRRLDHPGHEFSRVWLEGSQWHLAGVAVFAYDNRPCQLAYSVVCDAHWITSVSRISGWVGDKPVDIAVRVDVDRKWWLNGHEYTGVEGCIDLDLNFTPSTNLLPIRRLGLEIGQETWVTAAWLRFPEFRLEPLAQLYRRTTAKTYHYESAGGRFVAEIQTNEIGFVTDYPPVWVAE